MVQHQVKISDYIEKSVHYEDNTKHGHCSKCGGCCSALLPLCNEDISTIYDYLSIHNIKTECQPVDTTGLGINMTCPFLSKKKSCLIYEARPLICRVFKCNRSTSSWKITKLFSNKQFSFFNMWDKFFNVNIANFICSAIVNNIKILRRTNHE